MNERSARILVGSAVALAVSLALAVTAGPAAATWSIVAVDPETGEVGVALASCVAADVLGDRDEVLVPAVLVPGRAAGVSQGILNIDSPEAMANLLDGGATPSQVVDALLADDFEDQPTIRQYGIVALPGPGDGDGADAGADGDGDEGGSAGASAHTGEDTGPVSGDATGIGVAVQGVLMTDRAVLDESLAGFEASRAGGATLAEALAAGLAAGSAEGGDRRCDEQTALFAHLAVAGPDDDAIRPGVLLTVTVDEDDGRNPVPFLAEALADGRSGWIDRGANGPAGVPRLAVMAVGVALAAGAVVAFRIGMGNTSARR